MSSSKRFVFLFAIVAINLVFTIKEISFATPDANPSAASINTTEAMVSEGAVVANSAMPQAIHTEQPKAKAVLSTFTVTAYTNDPAETQDLYPGITASGTHTKPGVAASNVLPFGTKFRIPKYFGNQIFTIEDRMNERYNGQKIIDIWMGAKDQASKWGRRTVQLEIL